VAYTRYNPVLYPAFLTRNRMVTRVVAKQAKTTKVRNNFIIRNNKCKRILSCLFVGSWKVQLRRTNLGEEIQAKRSIYLRTSSLLSVLLRTRSAHRLSSQHSAVVSTPNIAELVPSDFSVHNHGFWGRPNTFCQEKHHFLVDGQLATGKEISSNIVSARGLVD